MIAIFDATTGELEAMVLSLDGHDMTGRNSAEVADGWQDCRWDAGTRAWVADPQRIASWLIGVVNAERERRQAALLTPGDAKAVVYAAKAAEVVAYAADPDAPVPFAEAEASASGRSLADVIADFAAGAAAAHAELARVEAVARAGIAAIRAAATIADMRAAAAAIDWEE